MNELHQRLADDSERSPRPRGRREVVGVLMLLLALPPLWNALGNPRVQALPTTAVLGLLAAGLVFGCGLGLLLGRRLSRGE